LRSIFKILWFAGTTLIRPQHFGRGRRSRSRLLLRADFLRSLFDQGVVVPLGLPDLLLRIRSARVCGIQAHGLGLLLLTIDNLSLQEIT